MANNNSGLNLKDQKERENPKAKNKQKLCKITLDGLKIFLK